MYQTQTDFSNFNLILELEEVILMCHTAVGQDLDQSVDEDGFPSIVYVASANDVLRLLKFVKSSSKRQ